MHRIHPLPFLLCLISSSPEFLSLKQESRILGHSSNSVCGFSMKEQVRLCAVWPMENFIGSSLNQTQGWTTVRESYSRALEQEPLLFPRSLVVVVLCIIACPILRISSLRQRLLQRRVNDDEPLWALLFSLSLILHNLVSWWRIVISGKQYLQRLGRLGSCFPFGPDTSTKPQTGVKRSLQFYFCQYCMWG